MATDKELVAGRFADLVEEQIRFDERTVVAVLASIINEEKLFALFLIHYYKIIILLSGLPKVE